MTGRRAAVARASPWLAALACLAAGCGGARPHVTAPPSEAEAQYPALAWVPAEASWTLVARDAGDLADAARELLEPLAIAAGGEVAELDGELVELFGLSPLRATDLAEAGLDGPGGIALFGGPTGLPTAVLAVADGDALRRFIDTRRPETGASSTLHRGHELYAWQPDGELRLSWVLLDGWLAIHLGPTGEGAGWLDALLAASPGRGLGDLPELAAALARGRAVSTRAGRTSPPTAIGLVRPALLAALAGVVGADGPCLLALAGAVTSISLSGELGWDGGEMEIAIGLSPAARAALAAAVGPAALPGLVGFREAAAVHASLALDLGWLERTRRAARCLPGLPPLRDPLAALSGRPGARAYHVAAQELDLADLSGRVMAQVALRDPGYFADQLDAIPGRSFLERSTTIAGLEVKVLDGLPGIPTLAYRLTDQLLYAAVGDGMMERLLAGSGAAAAAADPLELIAVGLVPGRFTDLGGLLALAGRSLGRWTSDGFATDAARRLGRYRSIGGRVVLERDALVWSAAMRLRR